MSDVEKTTSGEISEKSTQAAAAPTTATTVPSASTAAAVRLHQQQQQQQQQRQKQYSSQQHSSHSPHHSHYSEKASATAVNNVEVENPASFVDEHAEDVRSTPPTSLGHHCLSHVLKAVFSTPGLVLLVILYSIMGALLFPLLEAPQDITKSVAIAKSREDCLRELWIITEKLNVLYERNWTMLVHEQLRRFEGSIVAATRHGGLSVTNAGLGNNALAGRIGGQMDALLDARWTFSEALLYSVTVITTIGHGSLTPKTSAGKVATILYALIGVPLMLMCLSSLGALLAEALQCTYARICCRLARSGRGSTQQNTARQHCESVDGVDEDDGVGRTKAKEVDHHHNHHHKGEYPGETHELNCKSCKYDAVIGETNLNNSYDYKSVNGASMARAEESCQLLHNSSMSVNHVSPCMQLKSATMGANVQYYQQRANNAAHVQQQQQQQQQHQQQHQHQHQQQQQQHSHQHSDVMHMSSACAEATTASNSSLLSQKFPQPSTAASNANYCSRSATPSPQHLQHPLQQNYHLVTSSSTHSSPTHTGGYVRQNPLQQLQQHHMQQQQQQQHFVAVPSNVIRYQTTAATAAGATPLKGEMLNFYQPASVAVTGSATIYFPISAAAPVTTTLAATVAPHGTQLLYNNQPLVKYHTIQLQHKKPPSYVVADATLPAPTASQGQVTFATGTITTTASCVNEPLPPPPAYQTATVHGFRRAKFLTKPMAPGINTLIAEQDLSCRHDMSQHCNTSNAEPTTAATIAGTQGSVQATSSAITLSMPSSCSATSTATTTTNASRGVVFGMATTAATMPTTSLSHAASVDIMEDEEENEQQRMGNCPHGTPSRVPLISGANNSENAYSNDSKSKDGGSNTKSSGILSRGLMNSTAASFHRHTLHTFHRSGNRKSTMAARRSCTLHRSSAGRAAMLSSNSGGGCYGDTTETSDDDDYLAHGSTDFVLNGGPDDEEEEEEESDDDANCERRRAADGPQVPITIVLLILICYICLGTVIFAFWENWSLIDGAYFCFVTLSTIGYGDFLPERTFNGPEVQLFACCAYLLLGLVLVAMSFSILETQLMWKCKRIAVRLKLAKD